MCHFNHEQVALVGDLTSQEEGDDGEDEEAVSGGATGGPILNTIITLNPH